MRNGFGERRQRRRNVCVSRNRKDEAESVCTQLSEKHRLVNVEYLASLFVGAKNAFFMR